MNSEKFAAARWIRKVVVGLLIAMPLMLPLLMAAANSSLFTFTSSLPADTVRKAKAQPVLQVEENTIPDSLLHARWKIQKTAPVLVADLDSSALDLRLPENIKQQVEYDDSLNIYRIGSKIGDSYLNAPILMTPEEYQAWSEKRAGLCPRRLKSLIRSSLRRYHHISSVCSKSILAIAVAQLPPPSTAIFPIIDLHCPSSNYFLTWFLYLEFVLLYNFYNLLLQFCRSNTLQC